MESKPRKLTVTGQGKTYYVTLPKEMIQALKWQKGQKLIVDLKEDSLVIRDWEKKAKKD